MADDIRQEIAPQAGAREASLHKYAMLGYALHLLGLVTVIGFIAGIPAVITFGVLSFLMLVPILWYLYRMIRGLLAALDGRPMPVPQ